VSVHAFIRTHFQFEPAAPKLLSPGARKLTQQLGAHNRSMTGRSPGRGTTRREKVSGRGQGDFLAAWRKKAETTGEIAAFARALRDKSISPLLDAENPRPRKSRHRRTGGDR